MDHSDFYKLLGISRSATSADIKKAYRKQARKYHPDLNPDNKEAERKFKEVNEANTVLSDPEKRKKYDVHGNDWKHGEEFERAGPRPGAQGRQGRPAQSFAGKDFSDFFGSMFGGPQGQGQRAKSRGQDLSAALNLKLSEVYRSQQRTLMVNGKNIRLTFPAGIENGQTIKIAGYGSPGAGGGPNGDLYVTFSVLNDTKFRREGRNLSTDVEIDIYTALLGGEVVVETFDGKVKLKVPRETAAGTRVKLKAKGFPVYKQENTYGDLLVTYQVKLPTGLTGREIELFTELSQLAKAKATTIS